LRVFGVFALTPIAEVCADRRVGARHERDKGESADVGSARMLAEADRYQF